MSVFLRANLLSDFNRQRLEKAKRYIDWLKVLRFDRCDVLAKCPDGGLRRSAEQRPVVKNPRGVYSG
jgi:hypothetical protein